MSKSSIQYAGEFLVEEIKLLTVAGSILDIKEMVNAINIYEDLLSNSISGDITFTDSTNLINQAPIVGEELLSLRLKTPQEGYDELAEINYTKNPLVIYKVENVLKASEYGKVVMLSFTTQEMMTNQRTRISKVLKGKPSDMVEDILRIDMGVTKRLFVEETSNSYKFVAPNMHPFSLINMISRRSNSANHNDSPTFMFYETTKGYHFRSLDNLCSTEETKMTYNETIGDGQGSGDILLKLQNVEKMELSGNKDNLMNTAIGMYSGRLKVHDIFYKTISDFQYNYLDDFAFDTHVNDVVGRGNYPLVSQSVNERDERISDFPDATLHVSSTTSGTLFSETGAYPYQSDNIENWLLRRQSRLTQFDNALKITMQVPGVTHMQVGDVIQVNMLNKSSLSDEKFDKYYSGRYIISKLRHEFQIGGETKHTIYMEVTRDNVSSPIPSIGVIPVNKPPIKTIPV